MATFRYTLRTPDTVVKFGTESVSNWQDVKPSIVKNETYRGVFQTMTSTIEFTGNIRDLIIRTIDQHGYDAPLYLTVEVGNNNRERSSFRVYEGMENMKAELSDIDIQELNLSLNFVESGFVADLLNRQDVKVNLDVTETIDGEPLPPYTDLLKNLWCHDRKMIYNSKFEKQGDSFVVWQRTGIGGGGAALSLPSTIVYRSGDDIQSVPPVITSLDPEDRGLYTFLHNSDYSGVINVGGHVKGVYYFPPPGSPDLEHGWGLTGSFRWQLDLAVRFAEVRDGSKIGRTIKTLATGSDITVNNSRAIFDAEFYESFEIQEGDSVGIVFFILNNIGDPVSFEAHITTEIVDIRANFLGDFAETIAKCIRPHELFERLIYIITGEANAFYSDYFGRTELGYEQDGEGCNIVTLNGLMLRNFPSDKTKYNTSFKEAFEAYSKERNLVGSIEIINNRKVFRIEPYSTTYRQKVALKLGAVSEVSRSIDYEKIFTEIKVGSKNQEYEEVNGLYSFNGEFTFATPLKTEASVLNLISPFRKDDIGIELTRRQQYELDPTKDYRADKDIFMIDARFSYTFPLRIPFPAPGGILISKRSEEFENVEGIYEPTRAYNLNLSPGRQLQYWGNIIASGLIQKSDKKLKFVEGAKNQELITKKPSESTLVESADILIQTLQKPLILPDIVMIAEAKMTFDDYQLLSASKTELVEFENKGISIFGYIKLGEFDFERNICNFELERANY